MQLEMAYTWIVNKGKLADYFERNWLKYQQVNGRNNQTQMAAVLRISRAYFNQLLEGNRTTLSYHTALYIAGVFDDFEIMDILGYDYEPTGSSMALLPSDARSALQDAMNRISSLGMDADSPEAHKIFDDTMIALGYVKISTRNKESAE